jgi:hypothetical protein
LCWLISVSLGPLSLTSSLVKRHHKISVISRRRRSGIATGTAYPELAQQVRLIGFQMWMW